ncbi:MULTISPECIES: hypothetical protein [unclassified Clostridium]|uniref:hypothetical protein n=1 Tax=unclassified Clostridium TaxID=2614128 RepID=UPI001899936D|nr:MULTISPECIES: hypothetical protein [unclassified Clostridium]MCR1952481.1 hypothetical protein [Clostridium sp. DSM 100503]
MVLINDYKKVIIELTDDDFIYKSFFRKVKIKKSDIRSVFYDEGYLGILTYRGKIYSLSLGSLLWSEKGKLEDLRKELNKENILFDYTNTKVFKEIFPFYLISISIINLIEKPRFAILIFLIFIIGIIYSRKVTIFENNVFNIDKDELEVIRRKSILKYKRHEIDKIKLKRELNGITTIYFKKNGNKFRLYFKDNPYLIKIYDLSLVKLFG